jgi:hypothetical protein
MKYLLLAYCTLDLTNAAWVPPPKAARDWKTASDLANSDIDKMSLQDKITMASGMGWTKGGCVGNIADIKSLPQFKGECAYFFLLGINPSLH